MIPDNIKKLVLSSPLAKSTKIIQAKMLSMKMAHTDSAEIIDKKTVYCISPYKTGTTYLSRSFNPAISKHEPIGYWSILNLEKGFDTSFIRRLNYLNLKLECNGLWSAYVKELANNEIGKDLNYICILRSPSSWITSVINHFNLPRREELNFDIANELFWKQKVGVNIRYFNKSTDKNKQEIIEKLIRFYIDFTENTTLLNNVIYINLKDLDKELPIIGSLIQEIPNTANSWKRESKLKNFIYKNDEIDMEYELLTAGYIKRNKFDGKPYK